MGFLQLLDQTNEYLVTLDILTTLLLNANPIEMMDILQSLSQFYNILLFFTQYLQSSSPQPTRPPIPPIPALPNIPIFQFLRHMPINLPIITINLTPTNL